MDVTDSSLPTPELLELLHDKRDRAVAQLYAEHRPRLWRMVNLRMDPRLRGRVDEDDILQEAYIDAIKRLDHFLNDPKMSFFVWLRLIVGQTLINVHRRHLGMQIRDAGREVAMGPAGVSATSFSIAAAFMGQATSPSQAAIKAELSGQLESALETMNAIDREVLVLRHFEDLTNAEVAEVLGIQQKAASIRYIRAIGRLKKILEQIPGLFTHD